MDPQGRTLPGTGKSHLLIGLSTAAAMAGHRVRYVLAAKLVNEFGEATDNKQLTKTIACYGRVGLLCIDELGYLELGRRGAEMPFQVPTEREERNSVVITANEALGWTNTGPRSPGPASGWGRRPWRRCSSASVGLWGRRV